MANKISTVRTYPLTGSVKDFTITFEYLARKFVQVTLIGKDRKELVLNQDYRFSTKTQITTTRVWSPSDGYQMIEIRRFTSATDRLVDFADGSILRAYDLNISQIQTLHVAEEARDLTADTIGVNNDGHLDARGRKIVNLAFATGDYDAVPLKQIKERETSVWNAETKARQEADRSTREANRSRDEADRAKREADRSRNEANSSASHSQNSKTQADRSNTEANRAKGYADSMTASVNSAKEHADRSKREADRSRDEANRAAGEVTKAAAEVAKAAAHVATAKGHADRANTEANRSKSEADRAKAEADKLGNMNDFAGTIESVGSNGKDVNFKGGVNGNTLQAKDSIHVGTQPNTGFFNGNTLRLRNRDFNDRTWDLYVWGNNSGRGNVLEFGQNYGKGYGMYLQFATKDATDALLMVNGSTTARMDMRADRRFYTESTYGAGGYNMQLNVNGVYSQLLPGNQDGNTFYPLIKQYGRRSNGYPTSLGFGLTSAGSNNFHKADMLVSGDGGKQMRYGFDINGTFECTAGWRIPSDGNLFIKKYNSYLDAWVNKRLSEHAYNKSETNNLVNGRLTQGAADGRYIRKNAGWSEVWKGSAGGGVSVGLNQDVRWRTIWIQTQGKWNPVEIGDNGAYYISSMGGWLTFTISNNGRTFRNDGDRSSVPTRILVRNN